MSYGRSASGLVCSWGSKLDETVPRAKVPKRALPESIRSKIVGKAQAQRDAAQDGEGDTETYYKPGFGGVCPQRGAQTQEYSAGNQKHFLKRGSGAYMSQRSKHMLDSKTRNQARGMRSVSLERPRQSNNGGGSYAQSGGGHAATQQAATTDTFDALGVQGQHVQVQRARQVNQYGTGPVSHAMINRNSNRATWD